MLEGKGRALLHLPHLHPLYHGAPPAVLALVLGSMSSKYIVADYLPLLLPNPLSHPYLTVNNPSSSSLVTHLKFVFDKFHRLVLFFFVFRSAQGALNSTFTPTGPSETSSAVSFWQYSIFQEVLCCLHSGHRGFTVPTAPLSSLDVSWVLQYQK